MCLIYMPTGHDLESFLCSLELAEDSSEPVCSDGEQLDTLSWTPTVNEFLNDELKTGCSTTRLFSGTSEILSREDMRKPTLDTSMSSAPASRSHANPSVSPANNAPTATNEICGLIPFASLRLLDPDMSFSKMSPGCYRWHHPIQDLFGTWELYSETFPRSGIMQDGVLYRREIAVPRIYANGSGYGLSPVSSDGEGGIMEMRERTSGRYKLRDHVQEINRSYWPTPHTDAGHSRSREFWENRVGKRQIDLQGAVALWPTPRAGNPGSRKPGTGGKVLAEEVKWPTPTRRDYKDTGDAVLNGAVPVNFLLGRAVMPSLKKGSLNPDWVEWLMSFPISWTDIDSDVGELLSWDIDPADVGIMDRITLRKENRIARLRALGNAQVPICAITAWNMLVPQ